MLADFIIAEKTPPDRRGKLSALEGSLVQKATGTGGVQ